MPRGGRREKAGRKSGWSNAETQLIRVPKILANRLLEIAKHLDRGDEIRLIEKQVEPDPPALPETVETETPVAQLSIFQVEQEDELEPPPPPMSGRALAKRLNVSSGTLATHKDTTSKSLDWMHERDGNWGWFYSPRDGKYHPIHPAEFDHLLSELNSEENYEDF